LKSERQNNAHPLGKISYGCGCLAKIDNLKVAKQHAIDHKHTVTISGHVGPRKETMLSNINDGYEIAFVCGCGFKSSSETKAIEHTKKSKHKMSVFGKISPN
jgi:hypothetical protein